MQLRVTCSPQVPMPSTQAVDLLRSFAVSPALVAGPNPYQHYEFSWLTWVCKPARATPCALPV